MNTGKAHYRLVSVQQFTKMGLKLLREPTKALSLRALVVQQLHITIRALCTL